MPPRRPLLLLHGYSADGSVFGEWQQALIAAGWLPSQLLPISYESLANEVSVRDIAEAFDLLLRAHPSLAAGEPFDVLLHSTAMLVLRTWLAHPDPARAAARRARLRHVVALAPATFGSPLAHKGRSFLGALIKGRKRPGPDFLEAGDQLLDALELGSRFSWELAHSDLFGPVSPFGPPADGTRSPFLFIFCGTHGARGLGALASEPGSDGVVRWAGCALTSRKIVLDLTTDGDAADRARACAWTHEDVPMIPVDGVDHAGILETPPAVLVRQVVAALQITSRAGYRRWCAEAATASAPVRTALPAWQQFIVRALDERGDPVRDWNLQLALANGARLTPFAQEVHVYRGDPSLRTFHVRLDALAAAIRGEAAASLTAHLVASTGTSRVAYRGALTTPVLDAGDPRDASRGGTWRGAIDLSTILPGGAVRFFHPHTTTFLELRLDREPRIGGDAVARWQ